LNTNKLFIFFIVQSLKDFPEMLEKRPLVYFTDTDKKLVVLGALGLGGRTTSRKSKSWV